MRNGNSTKFQLFKVYLVLSFRHCSTISKYFFIAWGLQNLNSAHSSLLLFKFDECFSKLNLILPVSVSITFQSSKFGKKLLEENIQLLVFPFALPFWLYRNFYLVSVGFECGFPFLLDHSQCFIKIRNSINFSLPFYAGKIHPGFEFSIFFKHTFFRQVLAFNFLFQRLFITCNNVMPLWGWLEIRNRSIFGLTKTWCETIIPLNSSYQNGGYASFIL
jgi:hypothetical protein